LTHDDIPALLDWLNTPPGEEASAMERFGDYMLALDVDARERVSGSAYYGVAATFTEDDDFYKKSPADREIHRAAREDPEWIWGLLRDALCVPRRSGDREAFWQDILEDLVFRHEDQFIERLEALARDCPDAREPLAMVAEQGGERFARLQEELWRELNATR
jgi:hypothetical protein